MKIDRLFGILTILLQNKRVTAPELAARFEVNRRTIGRDIDALCQAGIPVVTQQGVGGGISIAEGFKLDKSVLTVNELSGIIAALKGMGTVTEKSQIERILDKLGANADGVVSMRESILIDLGSYYKGNLTQKIELLKTAISEARLISFDYYYHKGMSRRRIEPYFVLFQWTSWYVFGFCHDRQDWRLFKLMRLWDLSLTDKTFTPREVPTPDFNAQFTDEKRLVAVFHPSGRYRLIETYGLGCCQETPAGLRAEIWFTNDDYMLSWLLAFGDKVKVQEPQHIADGIKTTAKNILNRYS